MMGRISSAELISMAQAEGFDRAGVATLERSANERPFRQWLARGDHAEMRYLERRSEVRLDPRLLVEDARSVLCVALRYHPLSVGNDDGGELWPRVARYARGEDYHRVMERRLQRLEDRLRERLPDLASTRYYVDTGPVLERELAARAGLGSVGKNTNLLDPEMGSWFLLGEIFLPLDLEPAIPAADLCGTCSLCLEACPTGALPEPYRLDSRRCISYWTIEHRGAIPREVRPQLGGWVFGCDDCQEVCPVNMDPTAVDRSEFEIPEHRRSLGLADLLQMGRQEYVEAFRHSAMKRAKLPGLKRNVAVAMGNSGTEDFVEPLSMALRDPDPVVRGHAAWALGRLGTRKGHRALQAALTSESDPDVRGEIEAALQVLG